MDTFFQYLFPHTLCCYIIDTYYRFLFLYNRRTRKKVNVYIFISSTKVVNQVYSCERSFPLPDREGILTSMIMIYPFGFQNTPL